MFSIKTIQLSQRAETMSQIDGKMRRCLKIRLLPNEKKQAWSHVTSSWYLMVSSISASVMTLTSFGTVRVGKNCLMNCEHRCA